MHDTRVISKQDTEYPYVFSICTIVTNHDEYRAMKESFVACGFSDGCEYLLADNAEGNKLDAYEALAAFIKHARGRYVIIVHQDVLCIDLKDQLERCLEELTATDSRWAVCGNAGGIAYHEDAMYINNAGKVKVSANLPARVRSLDENFLVVRHDTDVTVSSDIPGFHLYGTDLCLIADILGYHAYVIPFMVKHLSYGNLRDLDLFIPQFLELYGNKLRARYVETTCTRFYLSNSKWKNRFYNSPFMLSLVKFVQRIKQLLRLLKNGDPHKKRITTEDTSTYNRSAG